MHAMALLSYTASELSLGSNHGLFPLGILDTATLLYKENTMDANLSFQLFVVPEKYSGHSWILDTGYVTVGLEICEWVNSCHTIFLITNYMNSPEKRDWHPVLSLSSSMLQPESWAFTTICALQGDHALSS